MAEVDRPVMVVTSVAMQMIAMVSPATQSHGHQIVGVYVCDVTMWEELREAEVADHNIPMPAWPTIQDILMNSMTPQMLSMQRTYRHTHASALQHNRMSIG